MAAWTLAATASGQPAEASVSPLEVPAAENSLPTSQTAVPPSPETPLVELATVQVEAAPQLGQETPLLAPTTSLSAEDLRRLASGTLGETLGWLPGVAASGYSAGSSRPVIRGLEGVRVRVLQDGLGTLDVSESSPDHGVAMEPLLLQGITVYRGAAALLFGNAAIGGAVDAQTRRVPMERPVEAVSGALEVQASSADQGWVGAGHATVRAGDLAVAVLGSRRRSGDYALAGPARSDGFEASFPGGIAVLNPNTGELQPLENPSDRLPNSAHQADDAAVGLAWVPEMPVVIGGSYRRYEAAYGVPFQFRGNADPFGETGLTMEQHHLDLALAAEPDTGPWRSVRGRVAFADYQHDETFRGLGPFSGINVVETRFDQQAAEGRLEALLEVTASWESLIGVQAHWQEQTVGRLSQQLDPSSRFSRVSTTENLGWFTLQTFKVDAWQLQLAGRHEWQVLTDADLPTATFPDPAVVRVNDRSLSGAATVSWAGGPRWGLDDFAITGTVSRVERLPTATERFAFYENAAIQRFLIGGDFAAEPLANEIALGAEMAVKWALGDLSGQLSAFHYHFDGFIFLQDLLGIGTAQFTQRDATFSGGELILNWAVFSGRQGTLNWAFTADLVVAEDTIAGQPLPRIPPARLGQRLAWDAPSWSAAVELRRALAQNRVARSDGVSANEPPTPGYTELNAEVSWQPGAGLKAGLGSTERRKDGLRSLGVEWTVFLRADNLLDAQRRLHTSFLKEIAPLPGRSLTVGTRWTF